MIQTIVAEHRIDRHRIFITGLSAGGAMAAALLAAYPEVFAGGAIIAGLPYGCAATIPEAFDRMRGHCGPTERELEALVRRASAHEGPWPTLSVWHGDADRTVHPSNVEGIIGQWRRLHDLGSRPTRVDVIDGHARRVWCSPEGRELIEHYTIAGMGHGTPIAGAEAGGGGSAGPYMLDAGISSTRRIAGFWGADAAGRRGSGERSRRPGGVDR